MARIKTNKGDKESHKDSARSPVKHPDGRNLLLRHSIFQELTQASDHNHKLLNDHRLNQESAGDLRLQAVNVLQQYSGNNVLQQMVQKNKYNPEDHSIIQRVDAENEEAEGGALITPEDERQRANEFVEHGIYGPLTSLGAGSIGGFDVTYEPENGIERIKIKGGVQFQDGLTVQGNQVVPYNADLQFVADSANNLHGERRAAFIAHYQWTAEQRATFVNDLIAVVRNTWNSSASGLHFFVNKPGWDGVTADVVIDTQLRAMAEGDSRERDDHLIIDAVREPPGTPQIEAELSQVSDVNLALFGRDPETAYDQDMLLSSLDVLPRADDPLRDKVYFEHNSTELTTSAKEQLDTWVSIFQGAVGAATHAAAKPPHVTLIGHTSASGSYESNFAISQQRARAVRDYIISQGFVNADTRITAIGLGENLANQNADDADHEEERRVDLVVDSGSTQIVATHEFGHAFGLADEYAEISGVGQIGTGGRTGTETAHHEMASEMTDEIGRELPGSVHENTDSIMSMGNVVRPQHYATFHDALKRVTGVNEWSIRR
jgi:outer membrane protein OmpA-like peptidoglycan-associated protein